jgi:hypothetical protein
MLISSEVLCLWMDLGNWSVGPGACVAGRRL